MLNIVCRIDKHDDGNSVEDLEEYCLGATHDVKKAKIQDMDYIEQDYSIIG